jgi:hypothetical protein
MAGNSIAFGSQHRAFCCAGVGRRGGAGALEVPREASHEVGFLVGTQLTRPPF